MEWATASLILGLVFGVLTFIWGIVKAFKKPTENNSWKKPMVDLIESIKEERKEHRKELEAKFKDTDTIVINLGNRIHDLETHKTIMRKGIDDLKGEMKDVSGKCDAILEKVIEYLSKYN